MEKSTISKTVTSSVITANEVQKLENGSSSFSDIFFPFLDACNQKIHLPPLLSATLIIYNITQMMTTSIWYQQNHFIKNIGLERTIITYFLNISYWGVGQSSITIRFVVLTVLFLVCFVFVLFQIKFLRKYHTLKDWSLYPIQIITEVLPMVILHPTFFLVGEILDSFLNGDVEKAEIVYLVFLIIYCTFYVTLFLYCGYLNSYSAYLQANTTSCFDFTPFAITSIANPIFLLVIEIFQIFPRWFSHPILAAHLGVLCYVIYRLRIHTFIKKASNYLLCGVCTACAGEDILCLISPLFQKYNTEWVMLASIISFLIVGIIISKLSIDSSINSIIKQLAYNNEINLSEARLSKNKDKEISIVSLTEEEKKQKFYGLELQRSPDTLILYLRVGLENMCDMLIDMSLVRFALEVNDSTEILAAVTRIIALFPSESRLLNRSLNLYMKCKDLGIRDRFLIYQLSHIKVIRQSSSSSMAVAQRILSVKQVSRQCLNTVVGFWARNDISVSDFIESYSQVKLTKSLWEESINEFPNSLSIYNLYTDFLIEGATDFVSAVVQQAKAELISNGQLFAIDYCFRSLAQCYPGYLKRKIFDPKGNFISVGMRKGVSASVSNGSGSHSISSISDQTALNASAEDKVSTKLIIKPKQRLSFQRFLEGKTPSASFPMKIFSIFSNIMSIGLIVVSYIVFRGAFDDSEEAIGRIRTVTQSRVYFSQICIFTMTHWAVKMDPPRFDEQRATEATPEFSFNISLGYPTLAIKASNDLRSSLGSFLRQLTKLAMEGKSVIEMGGPLMKDTTKVYFCENNKVLKPINTTMRTMLIYQALSGSLLNGNSDYNSWFEDNNFCSLIATVSGLSADYDELIDSLYDSESIASRKHNETIRTWEFAVTVLYLIINLVGFFAVILNYIKELNQLLTMMRAFETKDRRAALDKIGKNDNQLSISISEHEEKKTVMLLYIFFIILLIVCLGLITLLIFEEVISTNKMFTYIEDWNILSNMRNALSLEAVFSTFMAVWTTPGFPNSVSTPATTSEDLRKNAKNLTDKIKVNSHQLKAGDSFAPSWDGTSNELDRINYQNKCPQNNATNLHENYKCRSANHVESYFFDIIDDVLNKLENFKALGTQSQLSELFHIEFAHLTIFYEQIADELQNMAANLTSEYTTKITIIAVVGFVVAFVCLYLLWGFLSYLDDAFKGAMIILRRIDPVAVISHKDLCSYLLNQKKLISKDDSTSASIIKNSSDCIICINNTGIIEIVNNAVNDTLGYTPEQLLGQSVSILFLESDAEEIKQKMILMAAKQSSNIYVDSIKAKNDADEVVNVKMTLIGMLSESSDVKSYVLILRDQQNLIQQQMEAEEAKKRSEELLYQILPRGIVMRLNSGEKDVTFSVESASVMFIDIVKFSEHSAGMSPSEIMGSLSTIFCAFDEMLSKYPMVTKIKLIGDVYMAAAGLFAPEGTDPKEHAEQLIRFGLDCLNTLDEINVRLATTFQVRIGMNTGGPLLAGILGTDRPVFDIIGDAINVAARLQSTDVPGKIQICQGTYDCIKDIHVDIVIEPRGEIYLKGKGNQNCYLIEQTVFNTNGNSIPSNLVLS